MEPHLKKSPPDAQNPVPWGYTELKRGGTGGELFFMAVVGFGGIALLLAMLIFGI